MTDKPEETAALPPVDQSAMMARAIVNAMQEAQDGMLDVGLTLAALSKAAAMTLGTIEDKGKRLHLVGRLRLQIGLDTEQVVAMVAALPADKRPVTVDLGTMGSAN